MADFEDIVVDFPTQDLENVINGKLGYIPLKQGTITSTELREMLGLHPVKVLEEPLEESEGSIYQLGILFGENKSQIYMCTSVSGSYKWELVAETNISDGNNNVEINITTSIDENSTNEQIPSAKAVYDLFSTYDNSILEILGGDEDVE